MAILRSAVARVLDAVSLGARKCYRFSVRKVSKEIERKKAQRKPPAGWPESSARLPSKVAPGDHTRVPPVTRNGSGEMGFACIQHHLH